MYERGYVPGSEIAVQDALVMKVGHCRGDLEGSGNGFSVSKLTAIEHLQ